jgi:hypothetical protein
MEEGGLKVIAGVAAYPASEKKVFMFAAYIIASLLL